MSSPEESRTSNTPEDSWLRGYFYDREDDVLGGDTTSRNLRKNVDFLRLRDVALHLLDPRPGQTILDVGCADGATMVYCGLQGSTVYGQDLDQERIALANRWLQRFGIAGEACCGDATELKFPDNYFDGAISSDFFEHVTDETKVRILREIRRVLKPGRPLVIKTPNLSYLRVSLAYKRVRVVLRFGNPMRVVIPHTPGTPNPEHIGLTTRRALTTCLSAAGFLNHRFYYAPLRRFGASHVVEVLSTEVPVVRDLLCEDLFCRAFKPIALSHFPD